MLVSLLALAACRDPKVTAYRVPKEAAADLPAATGVPEPAGGAMTAPAAPAGGAMSGVGAADTQPMQTASGPGLVWTAPGTWAPKQASMMRKATFAITGAGGEVAELAVTAFPGDVGGDIANVNRWRGQVGLAPVGDAEAAAAIERLQANGLKIGLVDLVDPSATNGTHMLGAMVPFAGATWFFKMVGPDAVVSKEKPAFVAFLKSIKPATP